MRPHGGDGSTRDRCWGYSSSGSGSARMLNMMSCSNGCSDRHLTGNWCALKPLLLVGESPTRARPRTPPHILRPPAPVGVKKAGRFALVETPPWASGLPVLPAASRPSERGVSAAGTKALPRLDQEKAARASGAIAGGPPLRLPQAASRR
jgi:hypothetical protein